MRAALSSYCYTHWAVKTPSPFPAWWLCPGSVGPSCPLRVDELPWTGPGMAQAGCCEAELCDQHFLEQG